MVQPPVRDALGRFVERFRVTEVSIALFVFTTFAFGEGAIINAASKVLLVLAFGLNLFAGKRVTVNPFIIAAAGFLTLCAASLAWTDTPSASAARVLTLAYQFICYFVIMNMMVWKRERLEFALSWILVSTLASGAYVVLVQGATFQDQRFIMGVIPPGQLALACALSIVVSIYRLVRTRNLIYLPAIALLGTFLVLTSGRRGVLVVCLFIVLGIFFSVRGWVKKTITLATSAVVLGGLWVLVLHNTFLYAYVGHRIESFVEFVFAGGVGDSSTQGRQRLIGFASDLFSSSPLVGHGIDSFSTLFSTQPGAWPTSADNNYFQLLADLGVVGFLAYYVPLGIFLYGALQRISVRPLLTRFAVSCAIAMCLIDFASVWIFSKPGFLMLVLCYQAVNLERRTVLPSEGLENRLYPSRPGRSWWASARKGLVRSAKRVLRLVPDRPYIQLYYLLKFGRLCDFRNPRTYNDKLQWLKLHYRDPEISSLVDKHEVKSYVSATVGPDYVVPTLGVWDAVEDIDVRTLPSQFVLKCTHDSGGILIVKDRDRIDLDDGLRELDKALKRDFYSEAREFPYKHVRPRVIAEPLLLDSISGDLRDYKFLCFNGKVRAMLIAAGRSSGDPRFAYFDADFRSLPFARAGYPSPRTLPPKPEHFEEMIELAERLSSPFPHVRVDFYQVDGQVLVGELTFTPDGGFARFIPEEWNDTLGSWLTLPEPYRATAR